MLEEKKGQFFESLIRSNKTIKESRAKSISEDAQIVFKRRVEDLQMLIKRKKMEMENKLDLSPTNIGSLMPADKFDAISFTQDYINLGIEVRELSIQYDIAREAYKNLFDENSSFKPSNEL